MPNWCSNELTVSHKDPKMLDKFIEAFKKGCIASTFAPPPDWAEIIRQEKLEKMKVENPSVAKLADDLDLKIDIEEEMRKDSRWYDWNIQNWGTKWDFPSQEGGDVSISNGKISVSFDTAWAPPVGVYAKLREHGFDVRALYYEGGMGFGGIWENGDDYCEDNPDLFPRELIDAFDIQFESDLELEEKKEEKKE